MSKDPSKEWNPKRLDVASLARAAGQLSGQLAVADCPRLAQEWAAASPATERQIMWSAQGEWRTTSAVSGQAWLHLQVRLLMALQCQRCLEPVDTPLQVERSFRFVADERVAEQEDEGSDEDVLVLDPQFDLLELIEDELLMALPLVPSHDLCPTELRPVAQDADFDSETQRPHPFASLALLKNKQRG